MYVDANDISEEEQLNGETRQIPEEEYIELLKNRGSEKMISPKTASESTIAASHILVCSCCHVDFIAVFIFEYQFKKHENPPCFFDCDMI